MKTPIVVIVGCTASGKSELAEALAESLPTATGQPATIMAVDSMQVYRGMDIGTAKPDPTVRQRIQHLMIDVADPWETFSAARFVQLAAPLLQEYRRCHQPLILVTGTVLYLRALLEGLFAGPASDAGFRTMLQTRAAQEGSLSLHRELRQVDPAAADRIHPNDLRRIVRALEVFHTTGQPISELQTQWSARPGDDSILWLGIQRRRDDLNGRINRRVKAMITAGLVAEVQTLVAGKNALSAEAASAVGYRQILEYLSGHCTLEDATEAIKIRTRHLAKLQRTWLKRFSGIQWLESEPHQSGADMLPTVLPWLKS
ncbi:MAG: tRNA (adenosine(37)-N6)-dimethylallyltransferase MiaA [Phycisphaerae bacterium]|nr:tRNA (adenosine(37)-N6)-dimethylallyltransferase MiaA [Phycisphaerae bacterium]